MQLDQVIHSIGSGLYQSLAMLWAVLWALVLGFSLSGVVQAFVSRGEISRLLGDRSWRSLLRATGLGAASSSCSYAASAMAKSIFVKGGDFLAAMVFMFASTNLVLELGIVLAVLIGWQFTASEFLGGLAMILMLAVVARFTIPQRLVDSARARLEAAQTGDALGSPHSEHGQLETSPAPWRERLRNRRTWREAAGYTVADLTMLRRELLVGFLVAGFLAALVPASVWGAVFLKGDGVYSTLENAALGPLVAVLSFVCSVGNVPLAAALWKGGISFGGVVSFVFADLITLPLLLVYRRFYGGRLTLRLLGTFWLVMSLAGLLTQYSFSALHLLPTWRPHQIVAAAFSWDWTSWLDLLALLLLGAVLWLARRGGEMASSRHATDPLCGMQVERANAPASATLDGVTRYFCSDRCQDQFLRLSRGDTPRVDRGEEAGGPAPTPEMAAPGSRRDTLAGPGVSPAWGARPTPADADANSPQRGDI